MVKKTENMAKYMKVYCAKKKEAQRRLLQEQYENKWRTYLTNTEYILWCINTKKIDEVKSV